jgi:uncharacterized protein (TIGR02271 family)
MMNEMTSTHTTGTRTITALYDTRTDAEAAVAKLVAAGVPRSSIDVKGGGSTTGTTTATTSRDHDMGFWESLKDLFVPDDDRAAYAEGLRRGGHLVVVRADAAHYEQALDILDDEGTVDLEQRTSTWRSEGWTGYSGGTNTAASSTMGTSTTGTSTTGASTGSALGAAGRSASATTTMHADSEEVIPVVEEQLRVGKREVEHGRVRVRSYMVETPVQEQVTLREEHVHVERRPVDRAVTGNENLFQDRTIEATEHTEEAVVSKEARVKEELVIGKTAEQRTQTVSDSVRRTEVEVEDERGVVSGSSSTSTTTTPRRAG